MYLPNGMQLNKISSLADIQELLSKTDLFVRSRKSIYPHAVCQLQQMEHSLFSGKRYRSQLGLTLYHLHAQIHSAAPCIVLFQGYLSCSIHSILFFTHAACIIKLLFK